jgi:hypothetical protein
MVNGGWLVMNTHHFTAGMQSRATKEFTSIHQNIKEKRETTQKLEGPVLI